jgi:hypothetical protein
MVDIGSNLNLALANNLRLKTSIPITRRKQFKVPNGTLNLLSALTISAIPWAWFMLRFL